MSGIGIKSDTKYGVLLSAVTYPGTSGLFVRYDRATSKWFMIKEIVK